MPIKNKGKEGKNTGSKTRKAISSKQKKGKTLKQIGKKVNRSPSTVSAIKSGRIKNPPKNLAAAIRKVK